MKPRFVLRYMTKGGRQIALFNLAAEGCDFIQRVQEGLGSYDFERTEQPHNYDQRELDSLMGRDHG